MTEAHRTKENMTVTWERFGNSLWHERCDCSSVRCGIVVERRRDPDRTLIQCLSCGRKGFLPIGADGPTCVEVIP